jgi:hypothetical protein
LPKTGRQDNQGLLMHAVVHAADIQDRDGGHPVGVDPADAKKTSQFQMKVLGRTLSSAFRNSGGET